MSKYVWGENETQFFFKLTPDIIMDTLGDLGLKVTGRCLQLNSMENRVFEVEIDNADDYQELTNNSVVAKFYRPGRWTKEQILEEHQFLFDLVENEVPVIAPLKFENQSLFILEEANLFYTVFPKKGGRAPDEMNTEQLQIMGRMLARLHNTGESKQAKHRIQITPETFGIQNCQFLLENNLIPMHLSSTYEKTVQSICSLATQSFKNLKMIRIHGDCHCGNIISRMDEGLYFIDFDDMLTGPAVQDIWLITPGVDQYAQREREILLESYQTMRSFDYKELKLVEMLRSLRFIHFSAWIAKRWEDPAFKNAFPYFNDNNYWETQVTDLQKQYYLIEQQLISL